MGNNNNHNKQKNTQRKGRKNWPNSKRSKESKSSSGKAESLTATLSIESSDGAIVSNVRERLAVMSVTQDQSFSTLKRKLDFKNKNLAVEINMSGMNACVTDKISLCSAHRKRITSVMEEKMKKSDVKPENWAFSLPVYCTKFLIEYCSDAIITFDKKWEDKLTLANSIEKLGNAKCVVCSNLAKQNCLNCSKLLYCCDEHQKFHSPSHKEECYPAEEISGDDYVNGGPLGNGPYLKASKDLSSDDLIYEDQPLITGPGCVSDNPYAPFCLGCSDRLKSTQKCVLCDWPFCGPKCPAKSLHAKNECNIFRTNRVKELFDPFQYELVRILRCVLAKQQSPEKYKKLLQLDGALDARNELGDLKEATKTAAMFINQNCNLKNINVQTIDKICGIVHLQTIVSGKQSSSMQIYSFPSKLSHSCLPNTRFIDVLQPNGEHRLQIIALKSIKKGEPLTMSLMDPLKPIYMRDMFMKENYYFKCTCNLCLDASQAATDLSSLVCWNCEPGGWSDSWSCYEDAGYIRPTTVNMKDPWTCCRCDEKFLGQVIMGILSFQESDQLQFLENLRHLEPQEQISKLRQKITSLCKKFHPNNYYVWKYRRVLTSLLFRNLLYKAQPASYQDFLSMWKDLERQIYFLMVVVENLQPDPTVIRGQILFEAARALWAFIEWEVIFRKAESFGDHKHAITFNRLASYVSKILKPEVTSDCKSLLMDLNFLSDNKGLIKQRIGLGLKTKRLVEAEVEVNTKKVNNDTEISNGNI